MAERSGAADKAPVASDRLSESRGPTRRSVSFSSLTALSAVRLYLSSQGFVSRRRNSDITRDAPAHPGLTAVNNPSTQYCRHCDIFAIPLNVNSENEQKQNAPGLITSSERQSTGSLNGNTPGPIYGGDRNEEHTNGPNNGGGNYPPGGNGQGGNNSGFGDRQLGNNGNGNTNGDREQEESNGEGGHSQDDEGAASENSDILEDVQDRAAIVPGHQEYPLAPRHSPDAEFLPINGRSGPSSSGYPIRFLESDLGYLYGAALVRNLEFHYWLDDHWNEFRTWEETVSANGEDAM